MGGSGGGGTTSIQDIPREFKPAFTALFNSAFGASRTAAGQPGFGTSGPPGEATNVANYITGFGGQGNPFAPPGSPFQNPYQASFPQPNPNIFAGPSNVPGEVQGGAKGGPEQGFGSQQPAQGGQLQTSQPLMSATGATPTSVDMPSMAPPTMESQQAQAVPGAQADPFATSADVPVNPADPSLGVQSPGAGDKGAPQQQGLAGIPPGGDKGFPAQGSAVQTAANYPGSLEEGTIGMDRRGRGSTNIPLTAGPPIVGQPFGEQFTAGTSPLEFESLQQREAVARQLEGIGNPLLNLGNFTAQGGFLSPESNPFLMQNLDASLRPITQEFTNSVLPNFNSQAISSGAFGGSSARDMAFNQLASGYGQQMLDTGTGIVFDNYNRERQLQQNAGTLLDQGALLNQLSPELLAQVGLGQRELAQRPLDEALLQFQESINAPFRSLFPLASIIQGGDIGSAFSTTVPGPSALSSGIVGALGGAGAGAGVGDLMGGDYTGLAAALGGILGGVGGGLG